MRAIISLSGGAVSIEVVKMNAKTMIVRLPDGNLIKRHLLKQVPMHKSVVFTPTRRKEVTGFFRRLWFGMFGG